MLNKGSNSKDIESKLSQIKAFKQTLILAAKE
jgi:hypothetical protein